MEFFNRKEEVLDIKLTQYGKRVLSDGKFKPVYYAFFDDDIIYDTSHGEGGYVEVQKESEDRIKSALRPKAQPITYGLESVFSTIKKKAKIKEQKGLLAKSINDYTIDRLQSPPPTRLNNYALSNPIGSSEPNSFYIPYWNLNSMVGEIKSSTEYVTGSHDTKKIPQIDIDIFYETFVSKNNPLGDDGIAPDDVDGAAIVAGTPEAYQDTSVYAPKTYDDGTRVVIKRGFSLIDLIEGHTNDYIENFDIEVYQVTVSQKVADDPSTEFEILKKLKFRNNEYLELGKNKIFSDDLQNQIEIDDDYVEYYFEIKVDNQIEDIVRALAPEAVEDTTLPDNNFEEPCED